MKEWTDLTPNQKIVQTCFDIIAERNEQDLAARVGDELSKAMVSKFDNNVPNYVMIAALATALHLLMEPAAKALVAEEASDENAAQVQQSPYVN